MNQAIYVCDEDCGCLEVYGPGGNGAGISGHNITINGGNIYAQGGDSSPGIGLYGFYGTVYDLSFNGGNIIADGRGRYGAAGFGGGDCTNVNGVYIDGGVIKAKGESSGPGIGGGQMFYGDGGQAHNIIINCGTVVAASTGYGIGGTGNCSNIQINGGSVNASSIKITPVNALGEEVYKTVITLDGVNTEIHVTDIRITGADYYNIKDIFTDSSGKVYLYLPEDSSVVSIVAGGDEYSGDIITTSDGLANAVFEIIDTEAPIITPGEVNRISDTDATVTFTSDEAGEYYYEVATTGSQQPDIDTSGSGTPCDTSEQTISLESLSAGDLDIYILVKDAAGNVSEALQMEIPAYIPPVPGIIQFDSSGHDTYEGYNGWMIGVERSEGSDGEVSVSYAMADGTAKAGTHYQPYSGTLTWADGDSSRKLIMFTAYEDNIYNGYLDLTCILSNPNGGAVLGEKNPLIVRISDNDPPPVPAGLKAVAGKGQVVLNWEPVKDARYKLYYSTKDGEFTEGSIVEIYDDESYTMTGLKNGTTYYFAIKSGHSLYYSALSPSVSATPKAPATGGSGGGGGYTPPVKEEPVVEEPADKEPVITETETPGLNDISGHWAQNYIEHLVKKGAITGYPDKSFQPDATITRAEFAVVLVKAFGLSGEGKVFADTAAHWAKEYIATAAAHGIILGYNEKEFGPDDSITREQMAIMIVKAAGLEAGSGETGFTDKTDISPWAREWVLAAVSNDLISGYPDNSFKPQNNASRAEAVTVVFNALK
jgi:hypothetical protein